MIVKFYNQWDFERGFVSQRSFRWSRWELPYGADAWHSTKRHSMSMVCFFHHEHPSLEWLRCSESVRSAFFSDDEESIWPENSLEPRHNPVSRYRIDFASRFRTNFDYRQIRVLENEVRKAIDFVEPCRTAALGLWKKPACQIVNYPLQNRKKHESKKGIWDDEKRGREK